MAQATAACPRSGRQTSPLPIPGRLRLGHWLEYHRNIHGYGPQHHVPLPRPASSDAGGTHNSADAVFAQMIIPHHEQAVQMSDIMLAKDDVDPQITQLAEDIKAAQAPEIENDRLATDLGRTDGDVRRPRHGRHAEPR
jgi:uncharacterized protein (DUF305 family)